MDYEVFDDLIEGVQVIDRDFRYVYVNDAVARHGRSTKRALTGARMSEAYPGIEATRVYELIRACLEERRPSQLVNEFAFSDGSKGYFQLRLHPIPAGALILSFDVTEQRRADLALHALNEVLEARVRERTAQLEARSEELEQITYIASHDLQEPLRTIRSYAEVLEEESGDTLTGTARVALGFIGGAAARMQSLVRALLDYSRLGRNPLRETTDVRALVEEILVDLSTLVQGCGARVDVGPLPTVSVFRAEFRQLLQNLLSNALKFRQPDTPPHVRVTAAPEPGRWVFRVADNGIGFDMRFADRIFRVFQRLHAPAVYEGTGIGLANCKKIVALHGGEIGCESEPGVGSTFWFAIPRSETEEEGAS